MMELPEEELIPFALPDTDQREIDAVVECLRSGWLTTGPHAAKFERAFADYVGGGVQAVAVNSATAGLILALEAVGIGPGDEVITTPYTFSATAMSIVHLGARPVFADVDPVTLNIDPTAIEAAITPRTRAILPVHFAGLACDMVAIGDIARRHGLRIIEDAAHALPTTCKGRRIGAPGTDATVFSFYATKTITTGEGGMVTTADPSIAARCRVMRLHGINRDVFDRYRSANNWYYEIVAPGFKCNMTDLAAAIGLVQLDKADRFHARRCAIAAKYKRHLADLPLTLPADAPDGDVHAWHLFVVRLAEAIDRDAFIRRMAEHKVACSVHFIPLHLHPYWQRTLGVDESMFPMATRAYRGAVSLPLYTRMSERDEDRVVKAVRDILTT